MAVEIGRKLPASVEAEQALLGAILIKPTVFEDVTGTVYADDFYIDEHKKIFNAMQSMFLQSRSIDTVTLVNTLVKLGSYPDEASGVAYLGTLAQAVPTVANARDYAKIIHDKAILRSLIDACDDITKDAYTEEGTIEDILDASAQRIFDIAQKQDSRAFQHLRDVMQDVYKNLQILSENPNQISGVRTGFRDLDSTLVELGKGDLVLVGARPGMGKTSFVMNIAVQVAKASKKAVACFSLEMPAEQLALRMIASEALVESKALRSGIISPDEWTRIADSVTELAECDILIDDTSSISPSWT